MKRQTKQQWAVQLATITSRLSTCCRRRVGCVLLDAQWRVLATGFNGVARGMPHCNEVTDTTLDTTCGGDTVVKVYGHACPGSSAQSGTNLDGCLAIHAEQNALLQCHDVDRIHICITTASPCITCTKLLLNTGCRQIIYVEEYPHGEAQELWEGQGRLWTQDTETWVYRQV